MKDPTPDNTDILELGLTGLEQECSDCETKLLSNLILTMKSKFDFLSSTRFWALVIGAVAYYLQTKMIIGEPEMVLINTILGGFITLKTIDRASEQKVIAAKATGAVTTVTIPENVTSVSASTEK